MTARHWTSTGDYIVGWICALPCELDAARRALDRTHNCQPGLSENDQNVYVCGEIHGFNVVIACPPIAEYGTTPATITAQHMKASFKSLRYRFLVGVGGGAPSESNDIRLGDIVVSTPVGNDSGVIPYDWGKRLPSGQFQQIGTLNKPPQALRKAISCLKTDQNFNTHLAAALASIMTDGEFIRCPGYDKDRLFASNYPHPESEAPCDSCDQEWVIPREKRPSDCPCVHYGLIASGNQVMKDAITRDELAKSRGILCFEMEAAGVMDEFECLVVRGICDYSDSHKNKDWQPYAAASAAAYVKTLLKALPRPIRETPETEVRISPDLEEILRKLYVTNPTEDRRSLMARRGGPSQDTCQWIFKTDELKSWLDAKAEDHNPKDSVLWLNGLPGSGKSTMAMCLTEGLERQFNTDRKEDSFAYFFCESNRETQNTAIAILRGILWQLIRQNPVLQDWLVRSFRERNDTLFHSFDALWTVLIEIARDTRCGVVYCIIDALDECDSESQTRILEQLKLSFFDRPSKRFTSKVRILVTSRPYQEIASCLNCFPSRDIATFIEERQTDIEIFIRQKVSDLSMRKGYHDKMKNQVQLILKEKAGGTFLWIGLTCDELKNVDIQDTLPFLENLAPGLNALYKNLMKKAIENEHKRERIYAILAVVAVARQALSLSQLCSSCSLYVDEDEDAQIAFIRADIKSCRLMIVENEGFVNLLHKSVQDFLFGADMSPFPTMEESHAQLAYACISHLGKHFRYPNKLLEEVFDSLDRRRRIRDYESMDESMDESEEYSQIMQEVSKWNEFVSYSSEYWMEHAHLGGLVFNPAKVTEPHFLTLDSPSRDRWLRYNRLQRYLRRPGQGILHIAAGWGIPSLIAFALGENSATEGNFYIDTDFLTPNNSTPLQMAAKSGSMAVFTELISRTNPTKPITNTVLTALFQHNSNREGFITSVLQRLESRIIVTEEVEVAAVKSTGEGSEVVEAVLLHRDKSLPCKRPHVTEAVLVEAARNESQGKQIIELMFRYLQREVLVTERVLQAAAENAKCASGLLGMLLEYWTKETIPQDVVAAAAANQTEGPALIQLLQRRAKRPIEITDYILLHAFGNTESGIECIEQLWKDIPYPTNVGPLKFGERFRQDRNETVLCWALVQPSQRIVFSTDALRSIFASGSVEVIELVLTQFPGLDLSEDLLMAIASNAHYGASIFAFLFMSFSERIHVTEKVVTEAAKSKMETVKIILMHRPTDRDVVNEESLRAAACQDDALAVLQTLLDAKSQPFCLEAILDEILYPLEVIILFLDQPNVLVHLNEEVLDILRDIDGKEDVLRRVLTLPDNRLQVSGGAVETLILESGQANIELLLRCKKVCLTDYCVEAIVTHQDADTVSLMLNERIIELHHDLEEAACQNINAAQVLAVMIKGTSGDLSVNEKVLEIILHECKPDIIEKYLQRLPPQTWTRNLIRILVSHQSKSQHTQTLVQLLLQCHEDAVIAQPLIEEIAEHCDEFVLLTAIQRSSMFVHRTVAAAMKNMMHGKEILKLLIGDGVLNIPIDTEVVHNIARISDPEIIHRVIRQHGNVSNSLNAFLLCWAAAENRNSGHGAIESILKIFFGDDDERQNDRRTRSPPLSSWNPGWRGIPLTEAIVDALTRNQTTGRTFLRQFLHTYSDKVWMTGTGLRVIIKKFDVGFIREVISHRGFQLEVDDMTIQAGAGNLIDGPNVLDFLLSQGTSKLEITCHTISVALGNVEHQKALLSQLMASERVIFGQAAIAEILKTLNPAIIADLILRTTKDIKMSEASILEAICGMDGSIRRILDLFQLILSLNQSVIVTADMIDEIPCSAVDIVWSHDILAKVQELFSASRNRICVTEAAMIVFIRRCFGSLPPFEQSFSESLSQRYSLFNMYCKQLPQQGLVDEEVIVQLLHARHDEFDPPTVLPGSFHFAIPMTEDWTCPLGSSEDYYCRSKIPAILEFLARVCPSLPITTGGAMCILRSRDQMEARSMARLPGERFRMCQEVAVELASMADENTMAVIFDHHDGEIRVTEDMLLAIVRKKYGTSSALRYATAVAPHTMTTEVVMALVESQYWEMKMFDSLLRHLPSPVALTGDLLISIVEEPSYNRRELMQSLQTYVEPSVFRSYICETVLIAIAKNEGCGGNIMGALLEDPDPLPVTEEVIVLAARSIHIERTYSQYMTEAQVQDLLSRFVSRNPPSVEFVETAFSMFGPSLLVWMTNLYEQLGGLNPEIILNCPVRQEFGELERFLTQRNLLRIVDGRWSFDGMSDTDNHEANDRDGGTSTSKMSDMVLTDLPITVEMVENEGFCGPKDHIKSRLEQSTHGVVVAFEAFVAIIKHQSLSTIELVVSKNDTIAIPSMLLALPLTREVENMQLGILGRRSHLNVMEEIICAAVTNKSSQSVAILRYIFACLGCPTIISSKALRAAASSPHSPTDVLELLLCCSQGTIADIESIVLAAAANPIEADRIMALLFDHLEDQIQVSKPILAAAAENPGTKHAFLRCLSRWEGQVPACVFAAASRNPVFAVDIMELLLKNHRTPITQDVLIEAAQNESQGDKLLDMFFRERQSEFKLTEKVVKAALGRESHYYKMTGHCRVPELFLDPSLYVDPHSVQVAAVLSRSLSYTQFNAFLSRIHLRNPQDLALELAGECNDVTLRMILERWGSEITLSEELLKRAARNTHWRTNILKVFIYTGEDNGQVVTVTPNVVAAAAGNPKYGYESVQMLRTRRAGGPFVNLETLLAAASNEADFSLGLLRLLYRCSQCPPPFTTKLLSTAARNSAHGMEMLRLLLNRLEKQDDDNIAYEEVLEAAAANTAKIDGKWQKAAKKWADTDYIWCSALGLLIRKRRHRINFTERVLAAAAANPENGRRCVLLLIKCAGSKLAITENVLCAAAKNPEQGYDVLMLLLHHPRFQGGISENVIAAGVANNDYRNWKRVLKLLLSHHNAPYPVSERLVLAVVQSKEYRGEKLELLLRRHQGPICISDEVMQKVSTRLGDSARRRLEMYRTYPVTQERATWSVLWQLVILLTSCYMSPLLSRLRVNRRQ
ncbi:hypothetical protein AbraIFM66951_002818 [Aspergillus brasiliensis]|uniref:NACHT domain-containing protein n=1 Tax=Aspergillus brasiliensis TaxID=319629 RepID=A0A9W6DRT2_9EURO|nr:hypothetical protein AbraCBS73388_002827 [Aspergillus brasiliensis]GKZ49973.1 hypothetical protein AbraIFM66951_002818 [Aspergillus brasiliensis]